MTPWPHRIRRQRWSVRVNSAAAAFQLRQQLRAEWPELLLPAFERAFDQAAGGEEVLRIPKLELHLKVASLDQLSERLAGMIYEQLTQRLQALRHRQAGPNGEPAAWKISSTRQDRFDSLLHYLRTGCAVWATAGGDAGEFAGTLREICREQAAPLQVLLAQERAAAAFYFRLFQLLPAAEAGHLVRRLLAD